ncbi:MAG: hypothetical protein ACYTJ0_04030 [Planctomycetota bacterium]|jgi:endoglucanase
MVTAPQRRSHEKWLLQLTGIPTAAGREDGVVTWVRRWVKSRKGLTVKADAAGNLLITQTRRTTAPPLLMTAHMDHPAFVVREQLDDRRVELEFRGGVQDPYFDRASLELFARDGTKHRARVLRLDADAQPYKRVVAELARRGSRVAPGDIGRWAFTGAGAEPVVKAGLLRAPACDDLAGVAAALSALDVLRPSAGSAHVGVLLTVAEEVGFLGAIAACKLRSVPKKARLLCLENSRSFAESPIGGGPIIRVGDKMSVFSPGLTNRISTLMAEQRGDRPAVRFQRRLMPGGTCEATTFSTYGYESTCLCLPLGNYHNMTAIDEVAAGKRPARVGPEFISVDDYHGLVALLVHCAGEIDDGPKDPLRARMEGLYRKNAHLLRSGG